MRRLVWWWLLPLLVVCACWGRAEETGDAPEIAQTTVPQPDFVVVERVFGAAEGDGVQLPWIVALHGRGGRADRFLDAFSGWDGPPVRVLAVQAPEPIGEGFTWFPVRVGENAPDVLEPAVQARADALAEAIPAWAQAYAVEGSPVVTGFSQGAMLSYAVGLRHPDRVAAAVPVAGWVVDALVVPHSPTGATAPIRALHGTADTVLPFVPTRRAVDRLRASGFDVTLQRFDGVEHAIPPTMRRAWFDTLAAALPSAAHTPVSQTVAPAGPAR